MSNDKKFNFSKNTEKITKHMTYDILDEHWYAPFMPDLTKGTIDVAETWYTNGKEDGITAEMLFIFEDVGVKLEAFNDSWKLLNEHTELMTMLASCDDNITKKKFIKKLDDLGYENITKYEK